LYKKYLIIWV